MDALLNRYKKVVKIGSKIVLLCVLFVIERVLIK